VAAEELERESGFEDVSEKLQFFITDHAAQRACERLGVEPEPAWWKGLAERIRERTVRTRRYKRKGDKETCAYVFPARSGAGEEVDLVVVASSKLEAGRAKTIWFITIYIDGEE